MSTRNNGHAANGVVETAYTIHVTNIPLNLEEESVQSLFAQCGKVTGVVVLPAKNNTKQAYISYGKYLEAETAINEFDKQPPLSLNIEFKDKDLMMKSHQEQIKIDLGQPIIDYRYTESHLDNQKHAKKAIAMGKPNCTPSAYQASNYTTDDELLYPVPTDPTMCNPYEQPGPYKDLNLMYTRGIAQVLKDGRRRIFSGRGYTYYDLPEPHHNIGNLVANVCEIRDSGIYEYAPDDVDDDSGICKICSTPTAFRCQKCNLAFYCGRPCQIKDWPQHKIECQAIPGLVKKIPSMSLQNGHEPPKKNDYEATGKTDMNAHQKESEPQLLRRPKPVQQHYHQSQQSPPCVDRDQQQQRSSPRFNKDQQQQPSTAHQDKPIPKSPASVKDHISSRQTPVATYKAESTSFPTKQQKAAVSKSTTSEDDNIVFTAKDFFISKDKFERVLITTEVNKDQYWVQKVDYFDMLEELFENLKAYAKTQTLSEPSENLKCILEHGEVWYRATILAIHDHYVKVFFTDFGTYADVSVNGVIPINGFDNIPSLSRKICFVENTDPKFMNLKTGDTVYIKAVSVGDDGTIVVEVQEDKEKVPATRDSVAATPTMPISTSPKQPSPQQIALEKFASLPSVLDTLKVGQTGAAVMHAQLARNQLNATIVPEGLIPRFEELLGGLADACKEQIAKNPEYEPIIGDFICGQQINDEWYRGVVISLNPVKLAVLDEARVFVPTACTPLPRNCHEIVGFGLLAELAVNAELAGQTLDFIVLKVNESKDSAVISLSSSETNDCIGEAVLTKWTPKPEQKGIQWAKLKSGQEIQIICFFNQSLIFVHNLEPVEAEQRHQFEQTVSKCSLNRKPLRELPVVGQIVMAYFDHDENYYRAIVVRVESKSNIQIRYFDYGNEANVKFELLFELPSELKEVGAWAARIKLKGVPEDTPLTEEASSYFSELIAHQVSLTCTYTGNPAVDGVVLKTPRNETVNEVIKSLIEPTWQQKHDEQIIDKPLFVMEQLPIIKIGDVGDQVQAISLCYYEDSANLMLAPNDESIIQAIQADMVERIQEYVKNTPNHYIPREKELCIARYDGIFYRAVCIDSSASPDESRVLFIDYGNTERIKHKDIRLMTKDFMGVGNLAVLCSISPMVPDEKMTLAITKRLSELLPVNELITIKIISEENDGTPNIDIPEIRVKLIEEKLL